MNKAKVIKSAKGQKNTFWALLKNNGNKYSFFNTSRILETGEIFTDKKIFDSVVWLPFESTKHLNLNKESAISGYNRNSKLDFGMYEGYEVGIIYSFDVQYIIWCIENVESFYIEDLNILHNFGIMRWNNGYQKHRELRVSDFNTSINQFSNIQEIVKNIGMAFLQYRLPLEVQELNYYKKQNHS